MLQYSQQPWPVCDSLSLTINQMWWHIHGADEEIAALTELFLHWRVASIMVTELLSCEALNQGQFAYSFGSI